MPPLEGNQSYWLWYQTPNILSPLSNPILSAVCRLHLPQQIQWRFAYHTRQLGEQFLPCYPPINHHHYHPAIVLFETVKWLLMMKMQTLPFFFPASSLNKHNFRFSILVGSLCGPVKGEQPDNQLKLVVIFKG